MELLSTVQLAVRAIGRNRLRSALTLIGITICAFAFVRLLPGDPILALAGEHGVKPERYAELRTQFGFDLPIWEQYFRYVGEVLTGNFGISIATHRPVINEFLILFPATVELAIFAMLIAVVLGIPAGIFAAINRGKWIDQSQAHTVFLQGASGRKLSDVYLAAWHMGLKTTYYLRTLAASQVEKSTLDAGRFGFTQTRDYAAPKPAEPVCRVDGPDCEACQ